MSLSRDTIKHIAHLTRLEITPEEIDMIDADLNHIVDMVNQILTANTEDIMPMSHPLEMVQRLRSDEITETNEREALLALAPKAEAGLFLVPTVLE